MGANIPPIVLVIHNGPSPGQIYPVSDRPQTIGRGGSNDIVIPDKSISRLHARVRLTPHGYVVEDLGSTNGTYWGPSGAAETELQRLTQRKLLAAGDTVWIGGEKLSV